MACGRAASHLARVGLLDVTRRRDSGARRPADHLPAPALEGTESGYPELS